MIIILIIIIIIIITIIVSVNLAQHNCFTNSGDFKWNWITTNQIKFLVVIEKGKPKYSGKTPLRVDNKETHPTYCVWGGIEPEPHWWKASAITSAPTLGEFMFTRPTDLVSFSAVFRDVTQHSPERNGCSHSNHIPFPNVSNNQLNQWTLSDVGRLCDISV